MSDLIELSATELAALMRARVVSPVEVMEAHLRRIARANPQLNAIVTLAPDALAQAQAAEAALMRGEARGALCGLPVTVKDTIETAGLPTSAGSKARAGYMPESDAPAVARLKAAGAIILGKTNAAEMAVGYESRNPVFGRTNNPYDLERTAGGSSGGEAAAIAACLSPAGLGSDLVGSIRIPAHFCGIAGLKPTPEVLPAVGHIPECAGALALGASIGPMARYVKDLILLFDALTKGELTPVGSSRTRVESDALSEVKGIKLRGQRVAWYAYDGVAPVTEETRRTVETVALVLADAGLEAREERPPGVERGPALWHDLFAQEAAERIATEYAGREELAGPAVRAALQRAGDAPPPDFSRRASALGERHRLRRALLAWMEATPLLVAPVGAVPAFAHDARKVMVGAQEMSIFQAFSYAQTCNALGLPAVSVPVAQSRAGLPIGIQIIARPGAEKHLLAVALLIEEACGGYAPPPLALSPDAGNPL